MTAHTTTRDLVLAALFAALTAVGAYVSIPVYGPVPFTLQVLLVLVAGLVLGARLAALSMLVYLVLGLFAPVYAGGTAGLGVLFGPTGGYLWGFVLGATLIGALRETTRTDSLLGLVAIALAGLVPIYALGATWLAWRMGLSLGDALWAGVIPFVPWDAAKAVIAGLAVAALVRTPLGLPVRAAAEPSRSATPPSAGD